MLPFGLYTLLWFYTNCTPHAFNEKVFVSSGKKYTFILSNVPGFIKPVTYFNGYPAKRFASLVSGCGNMASGINIVSIDKRATFSITTDESQIEDLDGFARKMTANLEELGILYDPEEEGHD